MTLAEGKQQLTKGEWLFNYRKILTWEGEQAKHWRETLRKENNENTYDKGK